jgi:dTMP kinase
MKGKLIVFEGIDNSGKTTQLNKVFNWLNDKKYKVVKFRDPGTTKLGEEVRKILLHKEDIHIHKKSELFLFLTARTQLIYEKVKPSLENGFIVLLDRFTLSTFIYQGIINFFDLDLIKQLNKFSTDEIEPDIMFIFDIDLDTYKNRISKIKKDKMENKYDKYFQDMIRYYRTSGKQFGGKIINGNKSVDEVFNNIKDILQTELNL